MNLIESIENIINESEESASKTLDKIKTAIQNTKRPDFSKIKDGEHFMYHGIEFIRLGLEQGGVLCMTAKLIAEEPFDHNGGNEWTKSRARKKLNIEFLSLMDENDLLPFESDLTADNGDTAYGKCVDKIGILSCDLYRKYRKIVPLFDEWMWTCTPLHCGTPSYPRNAYAVRRVAPNGIMNIGHPVLPSGLAPACIFRL